MVARVAAAQIVGGAGGGSIQILQSTKTDTASVAFGSWADSGLSVTITLTNAASRVLLMADMVGGGAAAGNPIIYQFLRGSTALLGGAAAGSRISAQTGNNPVQAVEIAASSMTYLDTPGSVGPHTYKVQFRSLNGTVYINRSGTDTDSNTFGRFASTLIVMELLP